MIVSVLNCRIFVWFKSSEDGS